MGSGVAPEKLLVEVAGFAPFSRLPRKGCRIEVGGLDLGGLRIGSGDFRERLGGAVHGPQGRVRENRPGMEQSRRGEGTFAMAPGKRKKNVGGVFGPTEGGEGHRRAEIGAVGQRGCVLGGTNGAIGAQRPLRVACGELRICLGEPVSGGADRGFLDSTRQGKRPVLKAFHKRIPSQGIGAVRRDTGPSAFHDGAGAIDIAAQRQRRNSEDDPRGRLVRQIRLVECIRLGIGRAGLFGIPLLLQQDIGHASARMGGMGGLFGGEGGAPPPQGLPDFQRGGGIPAFAERPAEAHGGAGAMTGFCIVGHAAEHSLGGVRLSLGQVGFGFNDVREVGIGLATPSLFGKGVFREFGAGQCLNSAFADSHRLGTKGIHGVVGNEPVCSISGGNEIRTGEEMGHAENFGPGAKR